VARKKPERLDTSGPVEALGHNPFAALGGGAPPAAPASPRAPEPEGGTTQNWQVGRTRKGGWPLSLERRSGNKSVTVLGQVSGDAEALLKTLRKFCGAGGVVREDRIELQGDHVEALNAWLAENATGR